MWRLWCVLVLVLEVVCASGALEDLPWWKTAVFYQVYPRSFKDSDGDGVGDLRGIAQKADYLREVGVTALWLSPIFKSPMKDFGYDISDYRGIEPTFGDMADFDHLAKTLKALDIKLLMDLVPNHSSDQHEWFKKSAAKDPTYSDFYVWRDAKPDSTTLDKRQPPTNWTSVFSGPAWEWHPGRQQYYLHHFLKEQPDLNYRNPSVLTEMDNVINFWLDKGVDGFRVDAVPFLVEDERFLDEPPVPGTSGENYYQQEHKYTQNQNGTYEVLRHWADLVYNRTKADGRPRALFVEAYADLNSTTRYYGHGHQSLMQPFNFQLLTSGNLSTRPHQLQELIKGWMDAMPEGVVANWVVSNHDQGRIADRYGPEMVDAMDLLTGVLPGVKVVYNGEEIGMQNTYVRWDQTVDPSGKLLGPFHYTEGSRDPERTPMQWDSSPSAGFSTNLTTWLPVNPNYWWLNVEAQKAAECSHLKVFQALAKARKDPVLQRGEVEVHVPDDDTLLVVRTLNESVFALIINMGSTIGQYTTQNLFGNYHLDLDLHVVVSSCNSGLKTGWSLQKGSASVSLRPKAAVLLRSNVRSSSSAGHLVSTVPLLLAGLFLLLGGTAA